MKKFRHLKFVMMLAVLVTVWGCASPYTQIALQGSNVAVEITLLNTQFTRVESILTNIQQTQKIFTDEEWDTLEDVQSTIHMLLDKFSAITQFEGALITVSDMSFLWKRAAEAYTSARGVIAAHKAEITPSSWILLEQFDSMAESTNDNITKLMDNPTAANITKALTLIVGVVGIVVKIMGVAVI